MRDEFDFLNDELDSILAEFSSFSSGEADQTAENVREPEDINLQFVEPEEPAETYESEEPEEPFGEFAAESFDDDGRKAAPAQERFENFSEEESEEPEEDDTEYYEPSKGRSRRNLDEEEDEKTAVFRPSRGRKTGAPEDDEYEDEEVDDEEYDDEDDETDDEEYFRTYRKKKDSVGKKLLFGFAGLIFAAVSFAVLAWVGLKVHPDAKTSAVVRGESRANIFSQLDTYSNNSKGEVLGDLAYIRKVYSIPEGDLAAPMPNPASYGEIPYSNPSLVLELIQRARDSGLIGENETVAFNPNAEFFADDRNIQYYYDDTLLVIAWKELIENRICSFVEVKVGDASQFRRKLANDSFQTAVQINCSDLASAANAVVAMNADFYAFRDYGISVYQRQVYRTNPRMVDTCYITSSGDMIYSRSGELGTPEEAQAFVNANDVLFSLAFGPILIDNYEVQYCPTYPMGEPELEYSRAGIGQIDKLHYLYMTVNHTWPDREMHPRCSVNEFAALFATKPVYTAYNLDGGQTSEINIRGRMFNRVDWGEERPVSDIIYFATALPESEVTG